MRTFLAAALSLALASPVALASDQSLQLSRVKLPEAKTAAAVAKKHEAKRADPGLLLVQMMAFLAASQGQVAPGAAPDTANATQ